MIPRFIRKPYKIFGRGPNLFGRYAPYPPPITRVLILDEIKGDGEKPYFVSRTVTRRCDANRSDKIIFESAQFLLKFRHIQIREKD